MVRAQTTTGLAAAYFNICPPKGELHEPLCTLRDSPIPTFEFGPGPPVFQEFWPEQALGPSNIFDETWSFTPFGPGTMQWFEPWAFMNFAPVLITPDYPETWDGPAFNPIIVSGYPEPWEASNFIPDSQLFFEQWEAPSASPHAGSWFFNDDLTSSLPVAVGWHFNGLETGISIASGTNGNAIDQGKVFLYSGTPPWTLNFTFPGAGDYTDVTQANTFFDSATTFFDAYFVRGLVGVPAEIWTVLSSTGIAGLAQAAILTDTQQVTDSLSFGLKVWFTSIPLLGCDPTVSSYDDTGGLTIEKTFVGSTRADTLDSFLPSGGSIAIYVGVSDPGGAQIWRSTPGGGSPPWTLLHTFTEPNISHIRPFPNFNGNPPFNAKLYAALWGTGVSRKVYTSLDGITWSLDFTIPDSPTGVGQFTTAFQPASQFIGDPEEQLLLGVGTFDVSGGANLDAKVYGVDITEGSGSDWGLSVDFNSSFSDTHPAVTAISQEIINGNIYAVTGNYNGSGSMGGVGMQMYSCPFDDVPAPDPAHGATGAWFLSECFSFGGGGG
jgi:hypothetical protein